MKVFLAEREKLKISLYDVTGRKIISLFDGRLGSGEDEFVLDRQILRFSGVYFIRMDFGEEKRFELIKFLYLAN